MRNRDEHHTGDHGGEYGRRDGAPNAQWRGDDRNADRGEGRSWRQEPDIRERAYGRGQGDGSSSSRPTARAMRGDTSDERQGHESARERELGGYGPDPRGDARHRREGERDFGNRLAGRYGEGHGGYDRSAYAQGGYGGGGPRQGGFGLGLSGQGDDDDGRGYRAEEQPPYGVDDTFGVGDGQGRGTAAMRGDRDAGSTLYEGGEDQPRRTGGHDRGPGGSQRGRGPRNYSRSDERITEDLCERLSDSDDIDASEIEVRVDDGMAVLTGTVPDRRMKHRAEDLAAACSGVKDVDNRIQVAGRSGSRGT